MRKRQAGRCGIMWLLTYCHARGSAGTEKPLHEARPLMTSSQSSATRIPSLNLAARCADYGTVTWVGTIV
jgi:hypothetical protein